MSGGYFVFGDIKGGKSFRTILSRLLARVTHSSPHVLYLGAANLNDIFVKNSFEKGLLGVSPEAHFSSLNLWGEMPSHDGDARPGKIEKRFSEADIVFFDGGGIEPLAAVFERFNLADYARGVRERGGYVGGLCGGGSYLAERVVFHENGATRTVKGAGLIAETAISCHLDIADQHDQRISLLTDSLRSGFASCAIGLAHNQAVMFEENGAPRHLCADPLCQDTPLLLDAQGQRQIIPKII